jgi:hypothetical protein
MAETAETTEQPRNRPDLYRKKISDQMRRLLKERGEIKDNLVRIQTLLPRKGRSCTPSQVSSNFPTAIEAPRAPGA